MELTQKVIKVLKDVDKLVETVKKGIGQIVADVAAVKGEFGGKPPGEQEK